MRNIIEIVTKLSKQLGGETIKNVGLKCVNVPSFCYASYQCIFVQMLTPKELNYRQIFQEINLGPFWHSEF